MADYSDLNLNESLQPSSGLVSKDRGFISGIQSETMFEDNIFSSTNLQSGITIFPSGSTTSSGTETTSTVDTYTDIPNQTVTFSLPRRSRVLILYSTNLLVTDAGADAVWGMVQLLADGTSVGSPLVGTGTPYFGGVVAVSAASSTIQTLAAGVHTLKLQFTTHTPAGTTTLIVSGAIINYIILGN